MKTNGHLHTTMHRFQGDHWWAPQAFFKAKTELADTKKGSLDLSCHITYHCLCVYPDFKCSFLLNLYTLFKVCF